MKVKEIVSFEELDKIIDSYDSKDENQRKQKKAILILKADCEALKESGIPFDLAEEIINERTQSTEKLYTIFENKGNDDMALSLMDKAEKLNNVLHIVFNEEEDDE
jgi:hypothetical protein